MHLPSQFPLRSNLEHSRAMLSQQREFLAKFDEVPQTSYQTHVARRAGRITKASQAHVERRENSVFQVRGHLSIFDLFPNLDKLSHSVVDSAQSAPITTSLRPPSELMELDVRV